MARLARSGGRAAGRRPLDAVSTATRSAPDRAALAERTRANAEFFEAEAERLARLCHRMAERFARGGRLMAFGRSPAARSDARHVAVEFVHPVIVGKRALPAIGLAGEGGPLASRSRLLAEPDDIAIGFGADEDGGEAAGALAMARERGCLTLAFAPAGAEWEFEPPSARPAGAPGARRDALPRALGARARVLRPPRPARGPQRRAHARHRRVELPLPLPRRARGRPRGGRGGRARSVLAKAATSASCARRRSPTTATS